MAAVPQVLPAGDNRLMSDAMRITAGMTLVWDVDDVLNQLTRAWFEQAWLSTHPDCPVTESAQLTENPMHRLLGVTREEYLASLDAFRAAGYAALVPDADILAWMSRNGDKFRHVALTAVPLASASCSGEWIYRHWGRWIRSIHVVPSPRTGQEAPSWDASKVEYLRWFGHADVVLIEDNPVACAAAVAAGFSALRVPQPWNRGTALPKVGALSDLLNCEYAAADAAGRFGEGEVGGAAAAITGRCQSPRHSRAAVPQVTRK